MGSVSEDGENTSQQPLTVLITGFAPFKKDYPVNPSWEIVRSLPDWLPPLRGKITTPGSGPHPGAEPGPAPPIPPVRILVHPSAIRVNYTVVRDLVPKLWGNFHHQPPRHTPSADAAGGSESENGPPPPAPPKIDLAIHVGMAGPRRFYSIERRGHRDGYVMPDVDGQFPRDDDVRRAREGQGWVWEGLPADLVSAFDLEDVLGRWRSYSPKHMDLRLSEDAGHYLCDFIYFSSLAHLYKAGEERKVLFLHVPSDASEHGIEIGRELLLQLIRSVAESEVSRQGKETAERADQVTNKTEEGDETSQSTPASPRNPPQPCTRTISGHQHC